MLENLDFLIDKTVDLIIGFSLGILILILHRRADKRVHEKIEKLHEYIMQEESKMIIEMHKTMLCCMIPIIFDFMMDFV